MNYRDRNGTLIEKDTKQDRLLKRLYTTAPGRMLVRILITRPVTLIAGAALRTRVSAAYIKSFINKNSIDMSIYEDRKYRSFNDFFTREIRPGARTVDGRSDVLISPCDAKATAVPIERSTTLNIKGTEYTLESLLRNKALSEEFRGGMCIILRLTVDDYHRYCYACGGTKSENFTIKGIFHTVNPVAAEHAPIYKENSREYTVIDTDSFGRMVHMEVGALMVGKIVNNDKRQRKRPVRIRRIYRDIAL